MRKTRIALFLILTIVILAKPVCQLASGGWVVGPESRIATIKADGSIDPETPAILRNGNVYTLLEDLNGYIVIEQNGVVFDGAGYSVEGVYGPIPIVDGTQMQALDISGVTVKNTIVEEGGIIFYGWLKSTNIVIANNTVNDGTRIDCAGSGNLIANNTINGGFGIGCGGSFNTISGNNIIGCNRGYNPTPTSIVISQGSRNIIFGNNISQTQGYAIDLQRPSGGNVIAGNNIISNYVGVHTSYAISQGGAEGNIIYNNNFIDNGRDVYNEAIVSSTVSWNGWDNGKEGNFWSRYTGVDADKDGIGDTTYTIDSRNTDNYPLMTPVNISKLTINTLTLAPIPTPKPTSTTTPTTTLTPTPTQNPTTNQTTNPSSSSNPQETEPPVTDSYTTTSILAASITIIIAAVSVGLLFSFKNHKRATSYPKSLMAK